MNVLGHAASLREALALTTPQLDAMMVVAELPDIVAQKLNSWDMLPPDADIVWRGDNELARRFRRHPDD